MHQKMSFLSNGVDQVRSLRKITMWIRGTNFCINCTNSPRFAPSFMQLRNDPKCTQTLWNATEHEFRVQWGGSSAFVAKSYNVSSWHKLLHLLHQFTPFCTKFHAVMKRSQMHPNTMQRTKKWVYCPMGWIRCVCCEKLQREFVAQTFALIALVHPALHPVSCSYETIPNAPKPYATYQNMILWSNGMDQVCSLRKITKWLRGTNLCTNCTSSPHFASSFMQLRSDPKCTQTLCNTPKHEFMVQWGRSGAFVAKNYNVTSWHELWY